MTERKKNTEKKRKERFCTMQISRKKNVLNASKYDLRKTII